MQMELKNATLALKRFQPALKVVPNTAAEHGTVAEATGQTQPGRRQVLRFDGAERDSRGRLNAPFDNTSGRTRGPAPPCLADAVIVVAGPCQNTLALGRRTRLWRQGPGSCNTCTTPTWNMFPQTGKLVSCK